MLRCSAVTIRRNNPKKRRSKLQNFTRSVKLTSFDIDLLYKCQYAVVYSSFLQREMVKKENVCLTALWLTVFAGLKWENVAPPICREL